MSQLTTRIATEADADDLLRLMREYYAFDGHHFEEAAARQALLGLLREPAYGLAWVVFDNNKRATGPVGYAVLCFGYSLEYHGRDAFLDELYLVESYRGQGWGKKLLEVIEDAARKHDVRSVHLEVVRTNTRANEFYLRHGYVDHEHHLMSKKVG